MYHGRFIQGDTVPLALWSRDVNDTPHEPDKAPVAIICSDSAQIRTVRMPIRDRYAVTGFFQYPLLLDPLFLAGAYRVVYQWTIAGTNYGDVGSFEVVGTAGHPDGPGLAAYYYARPTSNFVLLQCDSGRIIRRRNPRL